ncbi:MAG: lytic transglycosylase domain-containing protein [Pyrinomonadaceae bacterium]
MTNTANALRLLLLAMALVLNGGLCHSYAKKRVKRPRNKPAAEQPLPEEDEPTAATSNQVRLKLCDGTLVPVEDAWESEQGIWYKQSGVTHLVPRDRVKSIERGSSVKPKLEPQIAKVTETSPNQTATSNEAVWIHLVGGARVEADSASESVAGVWYRRGPLSIFIERSRVDHIERVHLETLAESDSKKERGWSTGRPKIDALIKQNGAKYGVDPYLIFCVMEQESHFNSYALSPKGARGLMQLMPGTGARFGVRHPFDPAQNIAGGTRYLKQLLQQFKGRVDLVLASYNAGEGAVVRFGHRVPPYRETRNYVRRIGYRYRRGKAPAAVAPANTASVGGI